VYVVDIDGSHNDRWSLDWQKSGVHRRHRHSSNLTRFCQLRRQDRSEYMSDARTRLAILRPEPVEITQIGDLTIKKPWWRVGRVIRIPDSDTSGIDLTRSEWGCWLPIANLGNNSHDFITNTTRMAGDLESSKLYPSRIQANPAGSPEKNQATSTWNIPIVFIILAYQSMTIVLLCSAVISATSLVSPDLPP
jgi:hypothetical protein